MRLSEIIALHGITRHWFLVEIVMSRLIMRNSRRTGWFSFCMSSSTLHFMDQMETLGLPAGWPDLSLASCCCW